ncbi:valine--tRNA ligase [candidate division KSB1 bacterium]|nr:valine--tRNA ligase [candidate division KSB1 bacterium]MBL7093726.1 valine--tRNA ligase [candidate division KSB1 bacterium]
MSEKELAKVYDPKQVEDRWYEYWIEKNYFHGEVNPDKKPYSIVIPPPNVTDVLHMGHAYNNMLQDILIRFHRMMGYEAMWLPGTDHAGIATQNVVERNLKKSGKISRHDLGREEFVERVWQWKEKYGNVIIEQLKKMGCSCDWERERFTMDPKLSKAVTEVFCQLYEKGLIYRGKYIINWCPRCETALSDEEAIHDDEQGKLWYIKYPYGNNKFVTVATTRPETMLGDVAVAVHPDDNRFKKLIGKTVTLPVMNREIPVVADDVVDPKFGTGAVKVTPAHDPNDFEIGQRHRLEPINVMNEDGTMNENAGKYNGYDRFACRKDLVKELEKLNLLEKIENHEHAVAHCQRCNTTVEPYLSTQWFVKVKPLAEPALKVVEDGTIKLHPNKWIKIYKNWMENVRDWCISRQLWWGHRIPVYYCTDCDNIMVKREAPEKCDKCDSANIRQDEDVLDTWFSSWLWPFSTMDWPENAAELKYFYPTNTLVTAADIIFFWVARMVMSGIEFMGEVPFTDVYFNGVVRDDKGQKMSKSLGNGIDPLAMVNKYSADAVRFSLMMLTSEGQDINLAESKFEIGRNFSNKLWNSFRFLTLNFSDNEISELIRNSDFLNKKNHLQVADRWILSRLHKTIKKATIAIKEFHFNEAVENIYTFFWREYCDWYLELIKPRLYGENPEAKKFALGIGIFAMRNIVKLLHPFIPFITEEIWQKIKLDDEKDLIVSDWPQFDKIYFDDSSEKEMELIQQAISAVRNIRGEMHVPPAKKADVFIKSSDKNNLELLSRNEIYLTSLAQLENVELKEDIRKPKHSASSVVANLEIFVPLEGLIDIEVERNRLTKEVDRLENQIKSIKAKLMNQDFIKKAPQQVIEREKKKLTDFELNLEKVQVNLESLED